MTFRTCLFHIKTKQANKQLNSSGTICFTPFQKSTFYAVYVVYVVMAPEPFVLHLSKNKPFMLIFLQLIAISITTIAQESMNCAKKLNNKSVGMWPKPFFPP